MLLIHAHTSQARVAVGTLSRELWMDSAAHQCLPRPVWKAPSPRPSSLRTGCRGPPHPKSTRDRPSLYLLTPVLFTQRLLSPSGGSLPRATVGFSLPPAHKPEEGSARAPWPLRYGERLTQPPS